MGDNEFLAAAFEQHRDHLRAVAYRLLGSATDADDAVQDTWLRLTGAETSEVDNLGGWLTTVVARVSLNMLRSRRREQPVGDSWPGTENLAAMADAPDGRPGTVASMHAGDPEGEAVLADSVGVALLVVLDTLSPAERLAFVLHDMFAIPFTEVAEVLNRTPDATRQLASRARRRVRGGSNADHDAADVARQREVATAFLAAARGGDLSALIALLDPDVTLRADAGASPSGRALERQGVKLVAAGAVASASRAQHSQLALVDGSVGIVFAPAGQLQIVVKLTVSTKGRITGMDIVADPDKLRGLQLAMLPD
ncbi:MAG: sigma-70 family RNA polymerase sigma factor [Nocardiopsaceae bacterium]|jgi:RNA polymerase sigma-70 factor (ECF subfamily)|nr:sigma-70 family RNA polymerase sigma factor [Nocardiopsaceae bacterium]